MAEATAAVKAVVMTAAGTMEVEVNLGVLEAPVVPAARAATEATAEGAGFLGCSSNRSQGSRRCSPNCQTYQQPVGTHIAR